jgi:hypothetical protein
VRLKNGAKINSGTGLTIATDRAVYVQGDYNYLSSNLAAWQPAAIVGDAVTLLSSGWIDRKCSGNNILGQPLGPYVPGKDSVQAACKNWWPWQESGPMTVYAAVLAGHSPTPCDHHDTDCLNAKGITVPAAWWEEQYYYGGGLPNFLRFIEDWCYPPPAPPSGGSIACTFTRVTYKGSLVSLHASAIAKGKWSSHGPQTTSKNLGSTSFPELTYEYDTRFNDPAKLPPATPMLGTVGQSWFRPIY